MKTPVRLCRYRSLDGQSSIWTREAIVESTHFFSSPLSFNDPFDCRANFKINGSKRELTKYYEGLVSRHLPTLGREARRQEARRRVSDPEVDPRIATNIESLRKAYQERVTGHVGVLCLSENYNDILMWAQYGQSHQGLCLVFDPSDPFFSTAQPVIYSASRPVVNPLRDSQDKMLDAAMFTKSNHWAYEREWRILQYRIGAGKYRVPNAALKQVVLGVQMSEQNKALVRQWASEASSPVEVIEARLVQEKFEIEAPGIWQFT